MSITAAIHLFVNENDDPIAMLEKYDRHLVALGIDNDTSMLEYVMKIVVSSLLGCCNLQDSLNNDRVDSTQSCIEAIQSMTIWISFICHRAKSILFISTNGNPSEKVLIMTRAILRLGDADFALFVTKSLTRVLRSMIQSLPTSGTDAFSSCVKVSFRSCLAAISSLIGLVNLCQKHRELSDYYDQSSGQNSGYVDAYIEFRNFLVS